MLINLLFSSIENEIDSVMTKYGYPLSEDFFFENMNNRFTENLTKNINSVLHPDNFLVKIDLQIENYFWTKILNKN